MTWGIVRWKTSLRRNAALTVAQSVLATTRTTIAIPMAYCRPRPSRARWRRVSPLRGAAAVWVVMLSSAVSSELSSMGDGDMGKAGADSRPAPAIDCPWRASAGGDLADPLLEELVVGAVALRGADHLVDDLLQGVVAELHAEAVLLAGVELRGDHGLARVLLDRLAPHRKVVD